MITVGENSGLGSQRLTVLIAVAIGLVFGVSLFLFLISDQWERRVLFFPNLNSLKFEGEVRFMPELGSDIENIRLLLGDLLLVPSNLGNTNAMPISTELDSLMLSQNVLYVGFSAGAFSVENNIFSPRQMLQGVANTIFYNFNNIQEIRFFINGNELADNIPAAEKQMRSQVLRQNIGVLPDLTLAVKTARTHPVLSRAPREDIFFFKNGAHYDERIF
ncbi:MAG: hypothetical protein EHM28_13760 [Spirochaetaceae bacterium]|nr:MAG: hypothetical protein EHM28_13760 [Spirochaetaceae bacterium]